MTKTDKDRLQFDLASLRKKLSDYEAGGAAASETIVLNPLARQIANQLRAGNHSPNMVIGQLRLLEFTMLVIIAAVVNGIAADRGLETFLKVFSGGVLGAALCVLLLQAGDCYQLPTLRTPLKMFARIQGAVCLSFVGIACFLLVFFPESLQSWQAFAIWYATGAIAIFAGRLILGFAIRHWGRNGVMERRAVIVGGGDAARDLIRSLEQQSDNDIRICGIFDDRKSERSPEVVAGYPKLGTFAELVEFARLTKLDMLIIALPLSAEARILQLLRKLWVLPVDIRIAAHANKLRFRPRAYSHVGKVPMLDVFDKPIRDWDSVAKRLFDITFSLMGIALFWPVMLAAGIAVKATSKGPVLFKQKRHGFNNETINVWKFRSMYTELSDPTAKKAVTKNDPRVTPVGRFLRKSSMDELPQLFNVLYGDLSLVGPRPHAVHAQTGDLKYTEVVEHYFARHKVKPGVTGWAQINGWRGEIDHGDKIKFRTEYDLYYIENWSLFLDLKILFLTPIRLLKSENAY
ncbi:Undecaprenyl-phosphate glucose phosphotransferase [Agrobacterium fabrum]|uniref:polysaccharide biosynthesis glycosyltransferase UppE n=1 Tax=Agrobacterium fabrum TaxID=1176649 RepID=UPI0008899E90|nr:polysaccharide biosynthesis glycosyltransferase UppE [Agrobacterium fabrum]MDH6294722.1 Undecaprenyl-phosphate glucose phosphotransferase [Agrobacterium fabrum]SDB21442.1 Undecaprenyl-phosphate glucose phosphotransferase [Agrobacterium fabrum]SEQ39324.1 Undecaprenyl-phosphate glucose phosphotransferase [Agrobacterium fabrum]